MLLLAFVVIVAFAAGWKQITGDHLWTSIKGAFLGEEQTYEECVRAANDIAVEILKCKEKFGLRP